MAEIDYKLSASQPMVEPSRGPTLKTQRGWQYILDTLAALVGAPGEEQDSDLTTIAGLTPSNDDVLQFKSGAWANRTMAQLAADLAGLISGGWTQIATSSPSGVSTVTFSSIPATYSDLMVTIAGISHTSGSDRYLTAAFSPDGTNFTTGMTLNDIGAGASATLYGKLYVPGYTTAAGIAFGAAAALASSPGIYPTGEFIRTAAALRLTGGLSAIRFGLNSTGNFDAGTLTLYGK